MTWQAVFKKMQLTEVLVYQAKNNHGDSHKQDLLNLDFVSGCQLL